MSWRLEGGEAIWGAGSVAFSILLFRAFYGGWNWGFMTSLVIAAIPAIVTLVVILALVNGKPNHYAWEFAEWVVLRVAMGLGQPWIKAQFFRRGLPSQHPNLQPLD